MRPSGVTSHGEKTLVAERSVRMASHVLRVLRTSASRWAMPRNCGASAVIAAAGISRGARAPGQIPQPSLSSDPSGVVSSEPQQGAGDSEVVPLFAGPVLAGQRPHDMGLSGPHWHGFRMSACAMLSSARTIRTLVKMRVTLKTGYSERRQTRRTAPELGTCRRSEPDEHEEPILVEAEDRRRCRVSPPGGQSRVRGPSSGSPHLCR